MHDERSTALVMVQERLIAWWQGWVGAREEAATHYLAAHVHTCLLFFLSHVRATAHCHPS